MASTPAHRVTLMRQNVTSAPRQRRNPGRAAFWLSAAAFAWSVGLWAIGSATLIDEQGKPGILAALAVPMVLTMVTWLALHRVRTSRNRAARRLAWTSISVLALLAFLGGFSIGLFVLPIACLLIAAAALTPSRQ